MNPLLEYIKAQKPELAEVITVIDSLQSQNQETEDENTEDITFDDVTSIDNVQDIPNINNTKALKTEILKLKRLVKILKQEIINESQINNDFALAIGACTNCLGNDDYCESCDGLGEPGFFVPDLIHYKEFVIPAQKKYKLHFNTNNNY